MKRIQLEPWTTWEKLCLANAVQRTGDQNWTAVGRVVKNIYDDTMVYLGNEARPGHWFSMKQCAAQYETLLNSVLSSRRKKRSEKSADPHEQPSNIIYNILKTEFLEELDKKIEEDRIAYKKMKKKQEDILAGLYDEKLQDMLAEDVREKERDIKLKLKFKLGEKNAAERNNSTSPVKSFAPTTPEGEVIKTPGSNSSTSPLLTSLLQSPSQHSIPSTPTISLLLNSTPSTPTNESPTLSKLLESPSSKVPVNASSILNTTALPGVSHMTSLPGTSHIDPVTGHRVSPTKPPGLSLSEAIRLSPLKSTKPSLPSAGLTSSEDLRNENKTEPVVISQHQDKLESDGIHSEIVIEDLLVLDKTQTKKSDNEDEEEEEEVVETVEEVLQKLKQTIIETVGREECIDDAAEQDNLPTVSNKQQNEYMELFEVKIEEESDGYSKQTLPTISTADDQDDDDKIDADILAEAKSVVDRRLSDSEVQDSDVGGDQVDTKQKQLTPQDTRECDLSITPVEHEDNVELDPQAVEIIVMGSNSNSVVNVLSQDSSSEDVTQSSLSCTNITQDVTHPVDTTQDKTITREDVEEDVENEEDIIDNIPPESPSVVEEESQSSAFTEEKPREDKDDEEDKEELSSKEDETQGDDASSKDDHVSSRDECSSSVPDTMADQETTCDSIQQPSPPSISSRDNLPQVKITLEPLDISLSSAVLKEDARQTPVLDKIRRQSTRKRSSAHLDSKPSSPASTSFCEDEKDYRAWKKSVLLVFSRMASHKYASVFSKPISDTSGYRSLIKCPMDLSTIKKNIETGMIRTTLEFQRDVMLMIQNAVVYNTHDSPVYSMALEMWNDFIGQMNVFVQAVCDGVVLGNHTSQGETPSRPSRQAKQSLDSKTKSTPPTHATPKRRKI